MQCEVCGREISGNLKRVIIEGAKMITCEECAKLGSDYWTPKPEKLQEKPKIKPKKMGISAPPPKPAATSRQSRSSSMNTTMEGLEIVEGFGQLIKRAREKMGLTPEDLAKKIGEKESVIKKIESEKIIPDIRLAAKIEHALKVKLLVKPQSFEAGLGEASRDLKSKRTVTLGEVIHLKTDEDKEA